METDALDEIEVTMDDTLRDTFKSITEEGKPETKIETVAEPKLETQPEAKIEGQVRGADGKFISKPVEVDPANPLSIEKPKKLAPTTWRQEVKAKWDTLPPEVQDEIEKREQDMERGWKELGGRSNELKAWDQAIQPYAATINSLGIAPQKAVQVLFNADHMLRYGNPIQKAQALQGIIRDYGIDVNQMVSAEQHQAQPDPYLASIEQRLSQVTQHLTQSQQMAEQQKNNELMSLVDNFGKSNEHLDKVYDDVLVLLQGGLSRDKPAHQRLQDAYDKALWSKPELRSILIAEQQKKQAEESAKVAQSARAASAVNIPVRGRVPAGEELGTMDDTLRAGVKKLGLFG